MFKKFKDFYKRNRVYSILMIISIVCIVSILVGIIVYFLGQTNKDVYGNRLDGIEAVMPKDKEINAIKDNLTSSELVKNVELNIKGKIIYITITLKTGTHADAEALCLANLEQFSEDVRKNFDIHYSVMNEDKNIEENFPIMGSIKAENTVIRWTHYTN